MRVRNLFEDDSAVSPVIGVVLMVAITVILAAVIGSFVVGLGGNVEESAQASFEYDYDNSVAFSSGDGDGSLDNENDENRLDITHQGGDKIPASKLTVVDDDGNSVSPFSGDVTAGTTVSVQVGNDDTVRVVYTGDNGDSATLSTYEAPGA